MTHGGIIALAAGTAVGDDQNRRIYQSRGGHHSEHVASVQGGLRFGLRDHFDSLLHVAIGQWREDLSWAGPAVQSVTTDGAVVEKISAPVRLSDGLGFGAALGCLGVPRWGSRVCAMAACDSVELAFLGIGGSGRGSSVWTTPVAGPAADPAAGVVCSLPMAPTA